MHLFPIVHSLWFYFPFILVTGQFLLWMRRNVCAWRTGAAEPLKLRQWWKLFPASLVTVFCWCKGASDVFTEGDNSLKSSPIWVSLYLFKIYLSTAAFRICLKPWSLMLSWKGETDILTPLPKWRASLNPRWIIAPFKIMLKCFNENLWGA